MDANVKQVVRGERDSNEHFISYSSPWRRSEPPSTRGVINQYNQSHSHYHVVFEAKRGRGGSAGWMASADKN